MSECTHDCSSCQAECSSRTQSFLEKPHEQSSIKKIIGVISGKGGVGKSSITAMLAVCMARKGFHTAILDADITGPSIPKMFGVKEKATGTDSALFPVASRGGIDMMSVNLLLENDTDPVIWRGPVIAGVIKQFWQDVIWKDVDYMFVDMPPGTGDVPLTVFQSIPLDGVIIVASPQELVSMIVGKAVKMAQMMNIPILGLVENMSYLLCPDCGKQIPLFGKGSTEQYAQKQGLTLLAKMPVDPEIAQLCDSGEIESFQGDYLDAAIAAILAR
ncbi:Mrp/NBP35 family ATP-binding protein [Christensenellaceae bacterium 44-20]